MNSHEGINANIAERLGWSNLHPCKGPEPDYEGTDPDGEDRYVPDWSGEWQLETHPHEDGDPGDALLLCLEIQEGMRVEGYAAPPLEIDTFGSGYDVSLGVHESSSVIPAEALAKVALTALGGDV